MPHTLVQLTKASLVGQHMLWMYYQWEAEGRITRSGDLLQSEGRKTLD
jgi:hypothetical protein